ncbi:MAG: transketolase C-terminal domain-containing protein, partial [Acidimicrobiales bacterium]
GRTVAACGAAAGELAAEGVDATVWDVRVVSPPDPGMLADAARHRVVVTVEDGVRVGGAGTFLADALGRSVAATGALPPPVTVLGVGRHYVAQGEVDAILAELGLDGPGIAAGARRAIEARDRAGSPSPADPVS